MLADKLRSVSQQVVPPSGDLTFIGSSTPARLTSTSIVVTKPTDVASGDLLVVYVANDNSRTVTVPTGWTGQFDNTDLAILTRVVDGTDGVSYTFTLSASASIVASLVAFRNASFSLLGTVGGGDLSPSITTTVSSFVLDYCFKTGGGGGLVTLSPGWFNLSELPSATGLSGTLIGRQYLAGATGDISLTFGGAGRDSILASIASTGTIAARFVAVAHGSSPYISVYPFLENAGFGQKMNNPATLPGGTGNSVAFTASGDAIAIAHNTSGITAYPWSIDGFGARFTNPATMPVGTGLSVAFNDAEDAIIVGHSTTPFISAYPWSTSGFGTKYANPVSVPAAAGNGVSFNPGGAYVAVAHAAGVGQPCVSVYPWSAGFGAKITPSGTQLGSPCYSANFAPDNSAIAVSGNVTPYVAGYPWSGSFGTRYADPATLPPGSSDTIIFSPSGTTVAVAHSTTPFISAYAWSGGFGSKYADPASLPGATGRGTVFSDTEQTVFYVSTSTPFVAAYKWSSGFGNKYANPTTLPSAGALDVAFCKITL